MKKITKKIKDERHILFLCAPKASPAICYKNKIPLRSSTPTARLTKYELT